MIVNETKYNYEDVQYLYSKKNKSGRVVIARIIFVLGGLLMFVSFAMSIIRNRFWFANLFKGDVSINAQDVLALLFFAFELLFGIACFALYFTYNKFIVKQMYKRYYKKMPERHIEISDDEIRVTSKSKGMKEETVLKFSRVKGYCQKNNALYLTIDGQGAATDLHMAMHDDGYKKGTLTDVLELLEKHHCKEKE